jgi:hypothetical protein
VAAAESDRGQRAARLMPCSVSLNRPREPLPVDCPIAPAAHIGPMPTQPQSLVLASMGEERQW